MRARFFEPADAARWDDFCDRSYCATFLHTRRFLSYHCDRFQDRSVILESKGEWFGVLPAALDPHDPCTVVSHPGITYGNVVHDGSLRGAAMIEAFGSIIGLLQGAGAKRLHYKALPYIYHRAPAQDDLFALHRLGARRYRCDLSSCIDLAHRLPVSERRRRGVKKAARVELAFDDGIEMLGELWPVVEDNLRRKHETRPTHSLDEMRWLAESFADQIGIRVARLRGEVVAGIVMFRCTPVVHAQYIASNDAGRECSALEALFERCIREAVELAARYFDFGISTEEQGRVLNEGLYRFKSEFGSSGVVHDFYELDLQGA